MVSTFCIIPGRITEIRVANVRVVDIPAELELGRVQSHGCFNALETNPPMRYRRSSAREDMKKYENTAYS